MKEKIIFGVIFSFLIIFTASFILEINSAEAREATAHCATIGKNKDRMIKISYDQATGTHVCETTLKHFGVDFTVPDRCGQIAGLYLTDKSCQPPPPRDSDGDGFIDEIDRCPREASTTNNGCQPPPPRDSDGDGFIDEIDRCPREWSTTNNGCPPVQTAPRDSDGDGYPDNRDNCPREASTTNNGCPPVQTPSTQSEDWTGSIVGIFIALIIVGIIAAILKKKTASSASSKPQPPSSPPSSPPPTPPTPPTPPKPPTSGPSRFARTTCKYCHRKIDPASTIDIDGIQKCPYCGKQQ